MVKVVTESDARFIQLLTVVTHVNIVHHELHLGQMLLININFVHGIHETVLTSQIPVRRSHHPIVLTGLSAARGIVIISANRGLGQMVSTLVLLAL